MLPKPPLNVHSFPRPPLLERTSRHLQIKWDGLLIADTKDAYWVLETTHPPTYYLPPASLLTSPHIKLTPTPHRTLCEYKGLAHYHSLTITPQSTNAPNPSTSTSSPSTPNKTATNRIWSYPSPTPSFTPIKDYLSFYAGPWQCFVDGEEVVPQPGDFYGGWVTAELVGRVKGGPGTWGW